MTRILITGGAGFLARNIAPALAKENDLCLGSLNVPPEAALGTPVAMDVTQPSQISRALDHLQPALVVHAAAMTQPDECERRAEDAGRVIVEGTRNVAWACKRRGLRLVYISTDLVFNGRRGHYTEEDEVDGISVYSNAKILAEKAVFDIEPTSIILRVALLYGAGTAAHPGLIGRILDKWRAGQSVTFYTDQYRTPLFAPQVADVLRALLARPGFEGVLHVGGAECMSRFAFAELLAERVRAPRWLVRAGSMWDNKDVAPRGADCSLITKRLERELGIRPLTCSQGLDALVESGYLKPLPLR